MKTEWFWLKKDNDFEGIFGAKDFTAARYPYYMDEAAFDKIDDEVIFYTAQGVGVYDDFLFEPTFAFSERFESIFLHIEPALRLKIIQFVDKEKREHAPTPLYYIPFLPCEDVLHEKSEIVLGKAKKLVLKEEKLKDCRLIHAHLPADDIWLFSLEAAECILRRSPMGIRLERLLCL